MFVCNTTRLWAFPRPPSGRDLEHGERAMFVAPVRRAGTGTIPRHGAKSFHCYSDRFGDSCSAGCRREHLLFSAINDHSGLKKHGRHM
jgi:hypothetical protein